MKFIKNNKVPFACFLLLCVYMIVGTTIYYKGHDKYSYEKFYKTCQTDIEFRNQFIEGCNDSEGYKHLTADTATVFQNTFISNETTRVLVVVIPIIIIISVIWENQKKINSNFLKNYLTRDNYKNYLKKLLLSTYKNIWVLPAFIIVTFIMSFIISGHFDYSYIVDHSFSTFNLNHLNLGVWLWIGFLFNVTIHSLIYANITLICAKKNKNIILTIIESYLLWLGIEIILEVINSDLIKNGILNAKYASMLNIMDIYGMAGKPSLLLTILIGLGIFVITFILVILVYKNREKTVICFER